MSLVGRFGRGSLLLVAVPILSLIALWAFAASITLGDALNLRTVSTLGTNVGEPTDAVVTALQQERRATEVYLGPHGGTIGRSDLDRARTATDKAVRSFKQLTGEAGGALTGTLRQRISTASDSLDSLTVERNSVDNGSQGRAAAMRNYNSMTDSAFRLYRSLTALNDPEIAKRSTDLVTLSRARELLAREDALAAGALFAGGFTAQEHSQFVQLVGAQRLLYQDTVDDLPATGRAAYEKVVKGSDFTHFQAIENELISQWKPGHKPAVTATAWHDASSKVISSIRSKVELAGADALANQATSVGVGIIVRLVIGGVVGLLAVIASIYLSIRVSRSLMLQLRRLRQSALRLAYEQLPSAVERLRHGVKVDIEAEAPPLEFGTDEIGQVGTAFNTVHRTAIRAAVEQAELRAGVSNVFLNIARRSQTLLHTQLSHLDVMERKATEPEALEDLFRIDHLATRMRRNAENLVVLGGGAPGRVWREPVPLLDVLRSAASEVENYERVRVLPFPPVMLAGSVVSDVVHLAAELIDNAATFSPPHTRVHVTGQSVPKGFVVEIEDRGLGMSDEAIKTANRELAEPPEFDMLALSDDARLGMFVVARIAARHEIRVHLRTSPYGGTTAIILLPANLVAESGAGELNRPDTDQADGEEEQMVPVGANASAGTDPGGWPRLAALPRPAPYRTEPAGPAPTRTPVSRHAATPADPVSRRVESPVADPASAPTSPAPAPSPVGRARQDLPEDPPDESGSDTHRGLPKRVRQASLAPGLRATPHREEPAVAATPPVRSAEEIRNMMAAYQQGTTRGRTPIDLTGGPEPGGTDPTRPEADPPAGAESAGEVSMSDTGGTNGGDSGYTWPEIPDIPVPDHASTPGLGAELGAARWSSPEESRPAPVPGRRPGDDNEMEKTTELAAIEVGREERT